jgi:hypothetical protein
MERKMSNAQVKIETTVAPRPKPRPMTLVCVDGVIVGDAIVIVSHNDPNWFRPTGYKAYLTDDVVTVRRA